MTSTSTNDHVTAAGEYELTPLTELHEPEGSDGDLVVHDNDSLAETAKDAGCQLVGALEAGIAADGKGEKAAFAQWTAERGGTIAAGESLNGDQTDRHDTLGFDLSDFLVSLPEIAKTAKNATIKIDVSDPQLHGSGVVLGREPVDASDRGKGVEGLDVITDTDIVAEVAASHDKGRSTVTRFEADKLWTLNRITMKVDSRERKYFTVREYLAFQKAFRALANVPSLKDKFFSGQPYLSNVSVSGDPSGETTIPVVNEQCHPLDPARYIENAKSGVLMPYDVDGADTGKQWNSMHEYVEANRQMRARRPKPAPIYGSTLEAFFDYSSDEDGHPDIPVAIISPETPDADEGLGDVVGTGE